MIAVLIYPRTAISPKNKRGDRRISYLKKRQALLESQMTIPPANSRKT
jgi:hypothetical protein